jgi:hypothetical protein
MDMDVRAIYIFFDTVTYVQYMLGIFQKDVYEYSILLYVYIP